MNATFSQLMFATEGRYMTGVEEQRALAGSMELARRMKVSRMLQDAEYHIVDYATNAFCEIMPDFDGPAGSLRRKKGHQDGRIILRFIAQAIREGSPHILFEKVLSWLVGHLDNRNVSPEHMEVFFHFICQGAKRELPPATHPMLDEVFEDVMGFVRNGTHSGTILRAHRRIAEFAVERVMSILPETKAKYGASSVPKCKRDFEFLVKEVARVVKSPSKAAAREELSRWLIERLVNQVEYDSKVWYWSFLAMKEGIIACCGPEAGRSVNDLFETLANRVDNLLVSVKLAEAAGDIASQAAEKLLDRGETLGLLRADEFKTAVTMVNRQLLGDLAVLYASGDIEQQTERMAEVWCSNVMTSMPATNTSLLAANLQILLKVAQESQPEEVLTVLRQLVTKLVEVARRNETAERLSQIADQVAAETADWTAANSSATAAESRACFRDIRLVLAKMISLVPAGPAATNGHQLRKYVTHLLLPNKPANVAVMQQTYMQVVHSLEKHCHAEDARIARQYLEQLLPCFERYSRISGLIDNADKIMVSAVERGYQAAPRHDSLRRHGIEAGKRDGRLLLEKIVSAAVIGEHAAEQELHKYFVNEQVRFSRLPGGVVVEFLRGIHEQVRDFPEVSELVLGLSQSAAQYTAALKLDAVSDDAAMRMAQQSIDQMANYRQAVGEAGLEACARDNAITIRGLATYLVESPMDVEPFKQWWMSRIGKNIHVKPENFDSSNPWACINRFALVDFLREHLDSHELDAVDSYLARAIAKQKDIKFSGSQAVESRQMAAPVLTSAPSMTFADVQV